MAVCCCAVPNDVASMIFAPPRRRVQRIVAAVVAPLVSGAAAVLIATPRGWPFMVKMRSCLAAVRYSQRPRRGRSCGPFCAHGCCGGKDKWGLPVLFIRFERHRIRKVS